MDNTEEFRCISLCTGYAGLEMGIRRAVPSLRTVCYVEIEAFACANLVAKIEAGLLDAVPIWTDIKTFDGSPFRKRVHIITAGYPCQGESIAGKRQGKADPRWLWPYIERIIETVQPFWFFGENVSGHLSLGFPTVYRSLRNLGYKVETGLFTAEEVGAPHKRERLFILAYNGRWGRRIRADETEQQALWRSAGIIEGSSELANSSRTASSNQDGQIERRTRQEDVPQGNGQVGSIRTRTTSELADTTAQRTQRSEPERTAQAGRQIDQQGDCWPSRPRQPQYEWEEPRVVGHATASRPEPREGNRGLQNKKRKNPSVSKLGVTKPKRQAQSRLGRAVNGTSSRVDRLRLLGNGVVPQQAELAFRTLFFEANR